jgi:hypothetical protein
MLSSDRFGVYAAHVRSLMHAGAPPLSLGLQLLIGRH